MEKSPRLDGMVRNKEGKVIACADALESSEAFSDHFRRTYGREVGSERTMLFNPSYLDPSKIKFILR